MGATSAKPETIDISSFCGIPDHCEFTEQLIDINGHSRNISAWIPTGGTTANGQLPHPPRPPVQGMVLISHGLNEHSLSYYRLAQLFVQKNYAGN